MTARNATLPAAEILPYFRDATAGGKGLVHKEKALMIAFFFFFPKKSLVLQIFFKTVSEAPLSFFLSEYLLSS